MVIHLDPDDIGSPCPSETQFCIEICSLIDVYSSIFSCIISLYFCVVFFYVVLKEVRMSSLFIEGYLT